jgi:hypothetical protein
MQNKIINSQAIIYYCALYNCSFVASNGVCNHFFLSMKLNKKVIISFYEIWYIFSLNMIKCHIFSLDIPARENMWHFIMLSENIFHFSLKQKNILLVYENITLDPWQNWLFSLAHLLPQIKMKTLLYNFVCTFFVPL